jgi:hypothetical protein
VEIYPAHFFAVVSSFPQYLVPACVLLLFTIAAPIDAAPSGFLEGYLKIFSHKEVELAEETQSKATTGNYPDYPLIVLRGDGKKEIAHVAADENGNYRVALPPGDYVLDVQDRRRRHVRAVPQPFTIAPNQTAQVDMNIDTGVR